MTKLFNTILQLSKWDESNTNNLVDKWGFCPGHNTVDHLVTLRLLMDESWSEGATIYCFFVDFKKAFDNVTRDGLWQQMQELRVSDIYAREFKGYTNRCYVASKVALGSHKYLRVIWESSNIARFLLHCLGCALIN